MKKEFQALKIELIIYTSEDVVRTSEPWTPDDNEGMLLFFE